MGAPMRLRRQVQLKLEAEMRNLSMGQLLAEVASMAIKEGMIEEEAAAFACADVAMPRLDS
jgi:hypothetical protein